MTTYVNINGETRDAASLEFPTTKRTFREAWQFEGNVITVDMTKAREIVRDKLRAERAPKLAQLDTDWFRAAETANTDAQASIATQKQALRDITSHVAIDNATTPEELSVITLDSLLA
jgi:hypothetical protein